MAFLTLIALLPLNTVFVHWWVSWKPWLVVLLAVVAMHSVQGVQGRQWPWHHHLSIGAAIFLAAAAASWSGAAPDRYLRLLLALLIGALVMLVTERELRTVGMVDRALTVVYWTSAAMAATAIAFSLVASGVFGEALLGHINDIPGVRHVAKNVYLEEGMIALTNWHQDPGYAAAWMNLWAGLTVIATQRGLGSRHRWVGAAVIGGLWFGVVLTLSRTGIAVMLAVIVILMWHEHRAGRARSAGALIVRAALVTIVLLATLLAIDPPGSGGDLTSGLRFRADQGLDLGSRPEGSPRGGMFDNRREVWSMYWGFFTEEPIRGIGLGTGWANTIQEPHNLVLELLGETGLIGMVGFATLLVLVLRTSSSRLGRAMLAMALVPGAALTVLFEPTWWLAAGVAASAANQVERADTDEERQRA